MPTDDHSVLKRTPGLTRPRRFTTISILLFLASLALPAMFVDNPRYGWIPGYLPLLIGWLGVFTLTLAWFANPFLLVAWIALAQRKHRRAARFCSIAAFLLASSAWILPTYIADDLDAYKVDHYGPGYYLWLASIATVLVGSIKAIQHDEAVPQPAATSAREQYDPIDEIPVLEKLKAVGWITHYWSDRQDLYATFTDLGRHRLRYWPQHVAELNLTNENQRRVLEFFSHYLVSALNTPGNSPGLSPG